MEASDSSTATARRSRRSTAPPSIAGGRAEMLAVLAGDAIELNERVTVNGGLRFDHSRATSQDVPALDAAGLDQRSKRTRERAIAIDAPCQIVEISSSVGVNSTRRPTQSESQR